MEPIAKDAKTGCAQLAPFDATLLECQRSLNEISKLVGLLATIRKAFAIKLGDLDVKEVLGLMDSSLLIRGFEALRVGSALEETAYLPVARRMGLEDAQLGWVVGNGRDRRQDRQCAVPWGL
ncbi:MAG: hypothetical protein EB006_14535 [Betaproteobacteria bacterium]|nr:hypothetical protein [Betaproteobacteria bacterium]